MKLILKYLKNYKSIFILNFISVFGFALVELGIPTIMAKVIDIGIINFYSWCYGNNITWILFI